MKKIFIALIMCMFLITVVSAVKIDYLPNDQGVQDMKVSVQDTILFGLIKTGEQGTLELKSHKTPNEILQVGLGEQITIFYESDFKEKQIDSLGEVTFIDMDNGKEIEKEYKFVYWFEEIREKDTYSCKDILNENGTIGTDCYVSGKESYLFQEWRDYNSKDIPKGKIKLGIKVNMEMDETIDIILDVQGKKLYRHAIVTSGATTNYVMDGGNNYTVLTYLNNGTFNFTGDDIEAWVLIVGGGGAGDDAYDSYAGGGGAGEALNGSMNISAGNYVVTVGQGGTAGAEARGGNSSFNGAVAWGGADATTYDTAGLTGGSGSGGGGANSGGKAGGSSLTGTVPAGMTSYGNDGGTGNTRSGGGGGGCGSVGADAGADAGGGIGGNGINFTINGTLDWTYCNGGTGGIWELGTYNANGNGGAGAIGISSTAGTQGVDGTGSGGGGTADGGDGIVIIRYLTPPTTPTVTLYSPADAVNLSNQDVTFLGNISGISPDNVTLLINGTADQINTTGIFGNYTFDKTLNDGYWIWSYKACGSDGQCATATNRSLTIDTTNPTVFQSNLTDINSIGLPSNSTWSIDAYDLNLNQCYYNTSDDATQQIVTCNSTISDLEWTTEGNKTIQYCANDTVGFETCLTDYIWVYEISDASFDNPDPIAEGFDATFNLTVNRTNIPTTTASLILNNTVYSVTGIAGTNGYYFETDVNIPTTWGSTSGNNVSWYWNYSISGVGDYNTTAENLTVYELAIDDCSGYGDVILDFDLNDEETNTAVNESNGANVEIDLRITSKDNSDVYVDYNNTWTDENNPQVCIPSGLLSGGSQYTIDFTVGFQATDHVWEFYYLDGGTLNSTKVFDDYTDSTISLMDLLTTDSTSFLFNYFDEDGQTVPEAIIHVFRKYIGDGVFREVERATADTNGDTIVHLVEEDVIYYFVITDNGNTLFTTSQYTALCQATPCTISIEASGEVAEFPTDYDLVDNGAISFDEDKSSRTVTLTYLLNTSQEVNLTVYKYESDGSFTAINSSAENSIADTTGTITLSVPMSAGNVSFFSNVLIDGEYVDSEWIDFEEDASDFFGSTLSIFLAVLIILTLGLIAVTEGTGTIAFVVLGIFLSGALGLLTTELSTGVNIVIYLICAGGLIIWKVTQRRGG